MFSGFTGKQNLLLDLLWRSDNSSWAMDCLTNKWSIWLSVFNKAGTVKSSLGDFRIHQAGGQGKGLDSWHLRFMPHSIYNERVVRSVFEVIGKCQYHGQNRVIICVMSYCDRFWQAICDCDIHTPILPVKKLSPNSRKCLFYVDSKYWIKLAILAHYLTTGTVLNMMQCTLGALFFQ